MRLWTLDPRFLDRAGLCGLWREALQAQAVLAGTTVGYRSHPQLLRFRYHPPPDAAIATYLERVAEEGRRRGYHFDENKIGPARTGARIAVTDGQIWYEWEHLRGKLLRRDPVRCSSMLDKRDPEPHPLFIIVPGPVEAWEIRP